MGLKFIEEAAITGKKVLARFDFNVPLNEDGTIADTTRVDRALPAIKYVLEQNPSKFILMGHLGRPKGTANPKYSLAPVAEYLAGLLDEEVILSESAMDSSINSLLKLNHVKIIMLENLRFHPEETAGNLEFAKHLAQYGDVYLNDAFGTCHRKHASTYQIVHYFKSQSFAGPLIKEEVQALEKITENPKRPFHTIMGGAKIADKIKIIEKLFRFVDKLFVGGAMAYPFLKAKGHEVGLSLCDSHDVDLARELLAGKYSHKFVLPIDHVAAASPDSEAQIIDTPDIPAELMGLDIGPMTVELFKKSLQDAKTVFWNGPMGFFEKESFANGSKEIAKCLGDSSAFSLVGGGDSVSAVNSANAADKISHISTGGGAGLEFIQEGTLPGIEALKWGPKIND